MSAATKKGSATSKKGKPGSAKKGDKGAATGAGGSEVDNEGGDKTTTGLGALGRAELLEEATRLTEELNAEKEERNFFQLERDKIHAFWDVTKNEIRELKAETHNKDRELEELEEKHQVEIKVYKQKVKHLLYEYQNNVAHLQSDAEHSLQLEQEDHSSRETQLKKDKRALKLELKEFELSHEDIIKQLKQKNDQEISKLRADFERRAKELHSKYEKKMKVIRDDLELRRKNEIHEIEERKNGQINALMKNHEKGFAEIKNYYNDITLNNLALINSLKEQVEDMKKKEERNEKLMADITTENKRLSEPLHVALAEGESLRKQLVNYEKDKLSLHNAKARLRVIEEQNKDLQWVHEVLEQRFEQVEKERDQLYNGFVERIAGVQQMSGFKNLVLEKKMVALREDVERKELQLNEVLASANLDPTALTQITRRLEDVVDRKNSQIKELQYELAKLSKTHNDTVKVYEAKLTEYSIPSEPYHQMAVMQKAM